MSAGNYCGGFRLFPSGAVTVSLNTAFGVGEWRMITPITICRGLDPAPEIIAGKNLSSTSLGSQVKNAARALQINAHSWQTLACLGTQYAFYISKSPTGLFTKLAALSCMAWRPDVAENTKLQATCGCLIQVRFRKEKLFLGKNPPSGYYLSNIVRCAGGA